MLCEQVTNEDLISELLVLNDRLNEGLHAYDSRVAQDPPSLAPLVAPSVTDFSAYTRTTIPAAAAAGSAVYPTLPPSDSPAASGRDPSAAADFSLNPYHTTTPSAPPPAAAAAAAHLPPLATPSTAPFAGTAVPSAVDDNGGAGGGNVSASYGGFDANGMPWLPPTEDLEERAADDDRELATDAELDAELAGTPPPAAAAAAAAAEPLLQFDSPVRPTATSASVPPPTIGGDLFDLSFAPIGIPSGSAAAPSSELLMPVAAAAAPPPPAAAAAAASPSRGVPTTVRALSDDRVRKMEALENDLFGL